jgi:hypothetical protein
MRLVLGFAHALLPQVRQLNSVLLAALVCGRLRIIESAGECLFVVGATAIFMLSKAPENGWLQLGWGAVFFAASCDLVRGRIPIRRDRPGLSIRPSWARIAPDDRW